MEPTNILEVGGPMTIAALIQMLASIVGLPVLIYQVWKLRNSLEGATQDRLYAHYTEICKLFIAHPELRPYFYEQSEAITPERAVTPEQAQASDETRVAFMCETILGLVEHAVLQKKNLPGDAWKHCWRPYAIERLEQSKALEKFFQPNAHWYSHRMCKEMQSMQSELERKRTLNLQ